MNDKKETLKSIVDIVKEFIEYLDSHGLELDSNGDVVPKSLNKELVLELKDDE